MAKFIDHKTYQNLTVVKSSVTHRIDGAVEWQHYAKEVDKEGCIIREMVNNRKQSSESLEELSQPLSSFWKVA